MSAAITRTKASNTGTDVPITPNDNGSSRIILTVSDEDGGAASVEQTIAVGNVAPVVVATTMGSLAEGAVYTFAVTSTDINSDGLTYSLEGDVPAGAAIDPVTGVFTSTPTEAQGPASYTFVVRVTDGAATADRTIQVDVKEMVTAPLNDPVIVAPDVGGVPLVRVLDPLTGSERFSFYAYDPSFAGGVSVAVGDLDGDWFADIVTGAGPAAART